MGYKRIQIKQYEPCIQNNNNNNNNNNKIKIKKDKNKKNQKEKVKRERGGRERESEIDFYFFISLFASFSDLRKSDNRFSSEMKAKLIHAARAMRGYQNLGVSSNSTR